MGVVVCLPLLNHGPCAAPNTYKLASFPFFAPAFVYSSPFFNLFQALMGKHFPKVFQPTSNGCKLRSEGFSPCLCHGTLGSPKLWSVHSSKPVDPVVIINNAIAIATQTYLTIHCNCNGDN